MLFLVILLFAILYMATTAVNQNDKYLLSFLVLVFLAADINLHDPELTLIIFIVFGAVAFVRLLIDFSFISLVKNILMTRQMMSRFFVSFFFFSLGLFAISNALMIKDKMMLWSQVGEIFTTFVVIFWILALLNFIQIKYIKHFIFCRFFQKDDRKNNKKKTE